jgi:putative molybdopterin biosynthesis protein
VVTEQYDLVIPQEHFETDNIRALLDIINGEAFKSRVVDLGGYDIQKTGQVLL